MWSWGAVVTAYNERGVFLCSLQNFMDLMKDSADLLVDSVELYAKEGKTMDLHGMVGAMTVQVVGTTAFGCTDGHLASSYLLNLTERCFGLDLAA